MLNPNDTIVRPRITEKATDLAKQGVYCFEISPRASKKDVALAVHEIFGVDAVKVRVVQVPAKRVINRGKKGVKTGKKKAYVYLKKGDKIEFV